MEVNMNTSSLSIRQSSTRISGGTKTADGASSSAVNIQQDTFEMSVSYTSAKAQDAPALTAPASSAPALQEAPASAAQVISANTQSVSVTASTSRAAANGEGVIYQPSNRAALVEQLKAEQDSIQARFLSLVKDMLGRQGKQAAMGDDIWKQIASGDFKVTPEEQAAAKEAISEDGYWGVKQTSERLVGFAKALTGGDPSMVEKMRDAFIQGFKEAEKAWGGKLPDIAQQTYDATMKLFDEWAGNNSEEIANASSVSVSISMSSTSINMMA